MRASRLPVAGSGSQRVARSLRQEWGRVADSREQRAGSQKQDYLEQRMSFESNLKRLEAIVSQLESERIDLNASLKLFEEGIELLRLASEELGETESRVKELIERADGVLELRDLKH